jgi:hypothetical protein
MKDWVDKKKKKKDVEQPHLSLPGNCEKVTGIFHYKVSHFLPFNISLYILVELLF